MRSRLIIHSIVGSAMVAAWVMFIYLPITREQQSVELNMKVADRQLRDLQRSVELLPVFLKTRDQLQTNREDLNSRLFGKSEILELFKDIGSVADAHSLKLVEISPPLLELLQLENILTDTTAVPFLTLHLTLEGDYADFGRFVDELEQADFYRQPERCQIQAAKDADHPTQYRLDFKALLGSPQEGA